MSFVIYFFCLNVSFSKFMILVIPDHVLSIDGDWVGLRQTSLHVDKASIAAEKCMAPLCSILSRYNPKELCVLCLVLLFMYDGCK